MISVTSLKSYSVQHDVHFIHFVPTWSKINDKEVTTIRFLSPIHRLLIMSGFKISDVTEKCSAMLQCLQSPLHSVVTPDCINSLYVQRQSGGTAESAAAR